jgi:hypothetical protein
MLPWVALRRLCHPVFGTGERVAHNLALVPQPLQALVHQIPDCLLELLLSVLSLLLLSTMASLPPYHTHT